MERTWKKWTVWGRRGARERVRIKIRLAGRVMERGVTEDGSDEDEEYEMESVGGGGEDSAGRRSREQTARPKPPEGDPPWKPVWRKWWLRLGG